MPQEKVGPTPHDNEGRFERHVSETPQKAEALCPVNSKGPRQTLVATTELARTRMLQPQQSLGATEFCRQYALAGQCSCAGSSPGAGTLSCREAGALHAERAPRGHELALRNVIDQADCAGKDSSSSSSSSNGDVQSSPRKAHGPLVFCTVGAHSLPPSKIAARKSPASAPASSPQQNQQKQQQQQQPSDSPCDAPRGVEDAKSGDRCTVCRSLKAKAPSGFFVMQNAGSSWGQLRMAPCTESCEGSGGAGCSPDIPGGQRKVPSCDDCPFMMPVGGPRGGGPYHLLRQQQQKQGEFVAGSLQWSQPTSFWLVESARDEGVEREFRRLFRINSPTAFICLFCADVLFWCFFSCETALRARAMGLKRFSQDRQCLFDTFLQLVGLSAIFLRVCILTNVCGLGMRIFDPDSLEWKIGIANEFIVGDVQIALVALDTVQLARIYRLAFSCKELFFLTRSILHSLRSLLWTALFVLVVIYTCWNNVATATAEKHPFSRIFFVAYICFTTLTLLNIVTGIILDAYVDMSNRLLKEANYKDDLEKDIQNEKLLLSAFEKTSFLVCMRPAVSVSTLSSQGSTFTYANSDHATSGSACADSGQDYIITTHLREGETLTPWRHGGASSSMATQSAASALQSPRAPMCAAGAYFERKLTGVASEDSTARPSTEGATDSENLQARAHLPDNLHLDGISVRTCLKYLRIGGHQPMDILRNPIVQNALQEARIPFYQAFDVLSMYHQRGIQFVTVPPVLNSPKEYQAQLQHNFKTRLVVT
ncbi:Chromosome I, complete genome, related [Eimeria tenella]|uniref:Chromosome I, complete genome, related n=1 Tax=Eimeria tenella TaxID=5802 RepID=U6L2W6_EIMTE|nr:Chromosome I, complete genome, related [Eimeria tenella]CDJ42934.1 Chromosome I, complete genome, related [Eimeria tenella]|eukprot:XP_013233684.1 Chromosome I, complete genome, related [Eimeria tenella]